MNANREALLLKAERLAAATNRDAYRVLEWAAPTTALRPQDVAQAAKKITDTAAHFAMYDELPDDFPGPRPAPTTPVAVFSDSEEEDWM